MKSLLLVVNVVAVAVRAMGTKMENTVAVEDHPTLAEAVEAQQLPVHIHIVVLSD